MLDLPQIDAIATGVAQSTLPAGAALRAESRLRYDMDGDDELRVRVVIKDSEFSHITGEHVLDMVYQLQERLQDSGEARFAIVDFATDEELAADGGA